MEADDIGALIEEHGQAIFNFCVYVAGRCDAEELYQQTFLRALELAARIDRSNNPKSFIMSIAVNLWKNMRRKRMRAAGLSAAADLMEYEEVLPDSTDLAGEVQDRETHAALRRAVSRLEDSYRIPILLFYTEGMSIKDIAAVLRKPEGTIKRRLHEAKKRLKQEMEEWGYE